jgi:hypothetical protein
MQLGEGEKDRSIQEFDAAEITGRREGVKEKGTKKGGGGWLKAE